MANTITHAAHVMRNDCLPRFLDRAAVPGIIGVPANNGHGFSSPDDMAHEPRHENAAFLRAWPPMAGHAGSLLARRYPYPGLLTRTVPPSRLAAGKRKNTTA
jgi:hypothetical protein